MEFGEKLQQLRKNKGLTQEELANAVYVSRTAVSKWESGRGYPNIDSLRQLSKLFSISIDGLLSGDELLTIAEKDSKEKENLFLNLIFGLLDISAALFLFMPVFAQKTEGAVHTVSLLSLSTTSPMLKTAYLVAVGGLVLWGVLTLLLRRWDNIIWLQAKKSVSLGLTAAGTLLFIVSSQVYGAAFLFVFFGIKAVMLIKR